MEFDGVLSQDDNNQGPIPYGPVVAMLVVVSMGPRPPGHDLGEANFLCEWVFHGPFLVPGLFYSQGKRAQATGSGHIPGFLAGHPHFIGDTFYTKSVYQALIPSDDLTHALTRLDRLGNEMWSFR